MSSDCSAFSPLHALSVSNGLSKADKLLDDEVTSNASGQSSPLSPVSPRSQSIASPTPFSPSSSNAFSFSSPIPVTHKSVVSIASCDSNAVPAALPSDVNTESSTVLNSSVSGPVEKYIVSEKIEHFLKTVAPPTPYLVVDTDIVEENYRSLTSALPYARVFYAVKANPANAIMDRLTALGSCFDTASRNEIDKVLAAGNSADRISFGNTIKKQRDIEYAYSKGVRLYAVDSEPELIKIAQAAPGSRVFCRILVECIGAEWPLSKKFGCSPDMAVELLIKAQSLGLEAYGVSFHPGSQQTNLSQWDIAIAEAARVFQLVAEQGITLRMLNIGGGFPARYRAAVQPLQSYAAAVSAALNKHFPNGYPEIIIEPGRSMVGDAGVLQAEVVLISRKGLPTENEGAKRWVYLDAGKFNGLAETMDESIKYRIRTPHDQGPRGPVVLAGPTCDSADIMYEKHTYQLPLDLAIGDKVEVLSAGAYTTTYASVCFNGFDPLQCYCI